MKDKLLTFDYFTGLIRGWGLILYATLPSGLALLNILDIKTTEVPFQPVQLLFPIIPLLVLYVLIQNKQKKWFLKRKYLKRRTIFSLVLILILTTSICGISLLITTHYQMSFTWEGLKGVWQAFLMSVSSLVISATLFLTILTKKEDLPGIPSIEFTIKNTEIKNGLIQIKYIMNEGDNFINIQLKKLSTIAKKCQDEAEIIRLNNINCSINYEMKTFIERLKAFIETLNELSNQDGDERSKKIEKCFSQNYSGVKEEILKHRETILYFKDLTI
jgi:hypothetical protein